VHLMRNALYVYVLFGVVVPQDSHDNAEKFKSLIIQLVTPYVVVAVIHLLLTLAVFHHCYLLKSSLLR
jgi:hypothetical protein